LGIEVPDGKDGVKVEDVPMRSAMKEVTCAAYVGDCDVGVQRWNRLVAEAGCDFRFRLPSTRFHRSIGVWAGVPTDPEGRPITDEAWRERQRDWLPSAEDSAFVNSLMRRVTEPGKVAGWIAPPEIGINNTSLDYAYVRLN
jgi:benzoyl-CoA 2,3-epoxidase subunit B